MLRQPMLSLVIVWTLALIGWYCCVTNGGESQFSPYTLETRGRRELTLGRLPLYTSRWETSHCQLAEFLMDSGYVSPVVPQRSRWMLIEHWNDAWEGGQMAIYPHVTHGADELCNWSKADRDRAEYCWSRLFAALRSDDRDEALAGSIVFARLAQIETIAEFDDRLALARTIARNR